MARASLAWGNLIIRPFCDRSDSAPPVICVKGNVKLFQSRLIAMVGSRNASISGHKVADQFARDLGMEGFGIVSGLARGIDTTAHKASIKTGTIAVFAGGIDRIFPEENISLAQEIVENNGIIMTEAPIGWQPTARDFPKRNRIIAGLSLAVIIVEAAKRSGTLITARNANEAGRWCWQFPVPH